MKNKRLIFISAALMMALSHCAYPAIVHTNTQSLVLSNVADGAFTDFRWNWAGYDTEAVVLNYDFVLTGSRASFRMRRPKDGVIFKEVLNEDITIATTQLTFTVDGGTNMVPVGTYWAEVITYDTSTNIYRTVAQGMINVNWSLFKDDAEYFEYYTNTHSLSASLIVYGGTSFPGNVTFSGSGFYTDGTNFVFTGLGTGAVVSVFGRDGAVVAASGDYAAFYPSIAYAASISNAFAAHRDATGTNVHGLGTMALAGTGDYYTAAAADALLAAKSGTGTVATLQTDFTAHTNAAGTNVHGLGTMATAGTGSYYTTTAADALLLAKASTSQLAAVEAKADQGVTAYGWDNHASMGYLTATNTRYPGLYVADLADLGSNIGGLTSVYTGQVGVTTSWTGATAVTSGYIYAMGFRKQNNNGTATLSVAGVTLTGTVAGASSNYFLARENDTTAVLSYTGEDSSKSDISNVYVSVVTDGVMAAVSVVAGEGEFQALDVAGGTNGQLLSKTTGGSEWISNPISNWPGYEQTSLVYRVHQPTHDSGWLTPWTNAWGVGWTDAGAGYTNEGSPLLYPEGDTGFEVGGQFLARPMLAGTSSVAQASIALSNDAVEGIQIRVDAAQQISMAGYMYYVVGTSTSDVRSVTNIPSGSWGTSHSGASNDLWGLSSEDFTGQTNLNICVYGVSEEGDLYLDYLSANITYANEGFFGTNYFGYDETGKFIISDTGTNRYPLVELDTLSNQVAAIEGTDTNSFIAVSNRVDDLMGQTDTWNTAATDASAATGNVAILQADLTAVSNITVGVSNDVEIVKTNYAQLPNFIVISNLAVAVSNDVEIVKTNYAQLPDFVGVSNRVNAIETNASPYQEFTATVEAVDGTATVTYAHGSLPEIHATNDTTITFDNTDYPTNGVNRVRIALFAYTNTIAFDSTVINTNDFTPIYNTNTVEDETALYFYRAVTNLWQGRY